MAEVENWGSSKGRRSQPKPQEGIVAHSPGERSARHHVFSAHPTSPTHNPLHQASSPPKQPLARPAPPPPPNIPTHATPPSASQASPGSPHPRTPTPPQQTTASPHRIGNKPHRWARKEDARPKSAPPVHALRPFQKPLRASTENAWQQAANRHGRLSLFDHDDNGTAHGYLGPKILRDLEPSHHGFPLRGPDEYLKRREGPDLRLRNNLSKWLARHPVNRDPPFRKGSGGLRLSWKDVPRPSTMFRYLYDNGTIDFVSIRWGGVTNKLVWGQRVKRGVMSWGEYPADVEVGKWLPIFMEGVREYEEPYRFLAIRGSEALICEAASGSSDQLLQCAAECVPPLRKALDTREPTAVAIALELMLLVLRVDPQVATVWIYQLWQFAQILNLFMGTRRYEVNMGYNSRDIQSIKELCHNVLIMLEENGGEDATALIRRYARVDPACTLASFERRTQAAKAKQWEEQGLVGWKPFTLF